MVGSHIKVGNFTYLKYLFSLSARGSSGRSLMSAANRMFPGVKSTIYCTKNSNETQAGSDFGGLPSFKTCWYDVRKTRDLTDGFQKKTRGIVNLRFRHFAAFFEKMSSTSY